MAGSTDVRDTGAGSGRNTVALTGENGSQEPGAHLWSLCPPALAAYRCWTCGLYSLAPSACCGRRTRRVPAPYYIGIGTPPVQAPAFSVVISCTNELRRVRRTIESLQRVRGGYSVEWVLVDGCSTDGSLNYYRDLARHEAVQLIVTHPNERAVHARNLNRSAEVASGQVLLFADAGVQAHDADLLSRLACCLSQSRVGAAGIAGAGSHSGNPTNPVGAEREQNGWAWSVRPLRTDFWATRADVFAEAGGANETLAESAGAELDLQYRLVRRNYRLACIDSHVEGMEGPANPTAERHSRSTAPLPAGRRQLLDSAEWKRLFEAHALPRISVPIACRNYGHYLPRALDSVLGCYLPPRIALQIVVVNDASTDETMGILERYRLQYPEQVNVIRRSVSGGPAPAKNQAMARCIGDYVAPLDADDEFLEHKLWHCVERLDETGAQFLYHDFVEVAQDGRQEWHRIGEWSIKNWRAGRKLAPSAWVFRNGVVRFCERQITGEDPDFLRRNWSRLTTVYLPEALTRYHMHGAGLSTRAMCKVVTGQLKGLPVANVQACSDVPVATDEGSRASKAIGCAS